MITKKSNSFVSQEGHADKKKEVVWIRHAALKEHDLMIPLEGLNTLNDLKLNAEVKIGEVADGRVNIKELRRKNGELLDLNDALHTSVKKSEVLVAISDETVKAKKHIRIDHDALRNKKVELWLPIEDSVVNYDNFRKKVEDLLQNHLGDKVILKKMKALDEGTDIDSQDVLNKEIIKGTVILAQTKNISSSSCFCF